MPFRERLGPRVLAYPPVSLDLAWSAKPGSHRGIPKTIAICAKTPADEPFRNFTRGGVCPNDSHAFLEEAGVGGFRIFLKLAWSANPGSRRDIQTLQEAL